MTRRSSIQASDELKRELHERKRVGDSYEDVIWRLLEGGDGEEPRDIQEETTELVEDLDLPGGGRDLEQRRAALVAVLDHLQDRGEADRAELEEIADGFDHGYSSGNSLWKNCISKALGKVDLVEAEGPSGRWRWRG